MNDQPKDQSEAAARGAAHVPICAIGASAGGVPALQRLFSKLPPDLGLAYVVIVHLAPDHPSVLAEILDGRTEMSVHQVTDTPKLEPNCVYVIPPDRELVIKGDDVQARPFSEPRGRRAPIDMFFRSVAAARGDSMAVVLTGAGSDGALGVTKVKESGGVVFVQEPGEAEYPMMPRSAIATGAADFVASLDTLAERIAEVSGAKKRLRRIDQDEAEAQIRQIMSFLHARTGHDFSKYKRATVMRRVTRRMQVARTEDLAAYAAYLRQNPEEAHELFSDLLISVTQFFRDPAAFEALREEALDAVFSELDGRQTIRAWAVGCATGEEAYSLAILLLEECARRQIRPDIQVFATDLDKGALGAAREGRYLKSIEADVSDERLRRWFQEEGSHYRVRKEVRDIVLFASHSALKDPPFTRIDIVTCRNLLIYLDRPLQKQLLALFHYSLRHGGYLFLGAAETADSASDLFAPVDRESRIYSAKPRSRDVGLLNHLPPNHQPHFPEPRQQPTRPHEGERLVEAHLGALEQTAPPSALVDERHRIMHLSEDAGRFIVPPGGPMSDELPALVRPELRGDLRAALSRAFDKNTPTLTPPTSVTFNGAARRVSLYVSALPDMSGRAPQALVFFLDGGPVDRDEPEDLDADASGAELRRLREELRGAQAQLGQSRREYESAIQELRIANEELQSINEEYRSTSEELETSKEELQSANEELQTVNGELKSKLKSVSAAHSDLQNLVSATELAVLFLDAKLRIKMFTAEVARLFNIAEGDAGRPLCNFTHRLNYDGLRQDAEAVMRDLAPREIEVSAQDGRWFLLRLRPYRTIENRIDGVVLSFLDVTELRTATAALRQTEERLNALVRSTSYAIYRMSPDWSEMHELRGRRFISDTAEPIADWPDKYILPEDQPKVWEAVRAAIRDKSTFELEHRVRRNDGSIGWTLSRAVPLLDEHGAIDEWFGAASDVTDLHREQDALAATQELLTLATGAAKFGWGAWNFATGEAAWDARGREIIGLREDEATVAEWMARIHPEDRPTVEAEIAASMREARPFDLEYRVVQPEGAIRRVHGTGMFKTHGGGESILGSGLVRDVTERRRAENERELLLRELNHRVKNLLAVIQSVARQTSRGADNIDAFLTAFEQRLRALARAHDLLTRSAWTDASLRDLALSTLESFGGAGGLDGAKAPGDPQIALSGPEVRLSAAATITLAMALHELATNAVKYGAMSSEEGWVELDWTKEDGVLMIRWRERGGPAVFPPQRKGFGSRLIEHGVGRDLGGKASLSFEPEGVLCEICLPLGDSVRLAE